MKKETPYKDKKEVDAMSTATKLRTSEYKYLDELEAYIVKLKNMENNPTENAYEEAKKALLRTGVVTRSGRIREKIVSWE